VTRFIDVFIPDPLLAVSRAASILADFTGEILTSITCPHPAIIQIAAFSTTYGRLTASHKAVVTVNVALCAL
jgi:hypothetical protein